MGEAEKLLKPGCKYRSEWKKNFISEKNGSKINFQIAAFESEPAY